MGWLGKTVLVAIATGIVGMSALLVWSVGVRWWYGLPMTPRYLERVLGGPVETDALALTCTRCPGYLSSACGMATLATVRRADGRPPSGLEPSPFREGWVVRDWAPGPATREAPGVVSRAKACLDWVTERCQEQSPFPLERAEALLADPEAWFAVLEPPAVPPGEGCASLWLYLLEPDTGSYLELDHREPGD